MPSGRRSSSSRAAATVVLTALLGISGCAGRSALLTEASAVPPLRLKTIDEAAAAAPAPAPRIVPVAETPALKDVVVPASAPLPAWCRYLMEDAAAGATVLRSPSLSGQIDDESKGSVALSLSMSSFRKAQLMEQSAEVRCRRYIAETGLQKVVFTAPQTLSAAGYRAKAAAITRHANELDRMRIRIRKEIAAGTITAEKAAGLTAMIDAMLSAAAEARSEAERRDTGGEVIAGPAAEYSADLLRTESELADLDSKMRTADAFDVSLEAGYSDADTGNGFDSMSEGFSGKVKFSMKLGAMAPSRYEHERRAREARIAAVRDEEGGALWQVKMLREAHMKAISGLEESRRRLDSAIAETRKFSKVLAGIPDADFAGPAIEARLRLIGLEADQAAVMGSLTEIRTRLKQLAPG